MLLFALLAAVSSEIVTTDREYEGDWFISDNTNNNTGEREVYAMQIHLNSVDPEFVTVRIVCRTGKPVFSVDWDRIQFPDKTVITFAPEPAVERQDTQYVFEKSVDNADREMYASPSTSLNIVSSIGAAKFVDLTAHVATSRTIKLKSAGTKGAWDRVARHCPVKLWPLPPI